MAAPAERLEVDAQARVEEQAASDQRAPKSAALGTVALRDLAIVVAALSLWAAADTWYAVTRLGFAATLSFANGLLVGAGVGALLHEWGHFTGARLTGARSPLRPFGGFLPLFDFDMQANDERQFQWMSVGGNLAHWSVVLALVWLLPLDTPGRAALACGAFGFAVFASTTELPIIRKVANGIAPSDALVTILKTGLSRNLWIGFAAAIALYVFL